jgi:hypothetical protein
MNPLFIKMLVLLDLTKNLRYYMTPRICDFSQIRSGTFIYESVVLKQTSMNANIIKTQIFSLYISLLYKEEVSLFFVTLIFRPTDKLEFRSYG